MANNFVYTQTGSEKGENQGQNQNQKTERGNVYTKKGDNEREK